MQTGPISFKLSEPEESGSEIEEPRVILKNDEYLEAENQTEMEAEGTSGGNSSKISGRRDDDVFSNTDSVVMSLCILYMITNTNLYQW